MNHSHDKTGKKHINVACIGNPNCGKTTLFNALTGSKLKVANWPGVTVERMEGETSYEETEITLVDTPGIYSLTCYTIEEKVTRKCAMDDDIDAIINVVDASSLERNLYLTLQLLELGKPMVLALNMMDVVKERGMEIDMHRLPEMLGNIPVVPVSAARRTGLDILLHAVIHHCEEGMEDYILDYPPEIETKITTLEAVMQENYPKHSSARWHAIKLLEDDEEVKQEHPVSVVHVVDRSYEKEMIQCKYSYIEKIMKEILFYKNKKAASTDKIDRLLTHPLWGVPVFLLIMCFVFFLTFTVGDALKGVFETGLDLLSGGAAAALKGMGVAGWLESLMVEGIIAGVGGILTFIPNIFILFLALAMLEDSGYMARAAFVMDRTLRHFGLSGKAFIPMLMGFGCTVPAVMGARTMENEKDRRMTILLVPFMSCGARLPIYGLMTSAFFPDRAGLVVFCLYLLGPVMAIVSGLILKRSVFQGEPAPFLLELPPYRMPTLKNIWLHVWERVRDFLTRAGTIIAAMSVVVWFLQSFGADLRMVEDTSDSILALVGGLLAPVFAPMGFGVWQAAVALLTGLIAKEAVVSSMSLFYGFSLTDYAAAGAAMAATFSPAAAVAFLVFCALYTPCVAAIATIRREMNSLSWTALALVWQLGTAWLASFAVYQLAQLLL